MAGMNGVSGYGSSGNMSSIRGFGGLASGMDRDSLIESMLYGTTSKITKQQLKKTTLQWQQNAIRNITDKMIGFANKYTATLTSASNLFNTNFWGKTQISVLGENSKYVSVSGTSKTADNISIMGVKKLAEKAKLTSEAAVSDGELRTGALDLSTKEITDLIGKDITFKYGGEGGKTYSIRLAEGEYEIEEKDDAGNVIKDAEGNPVMKKGEYKYETAQDVVDSINVLLEKQTLSGSDKKLSTVVKAELGEDGKSIVFKNESVNALSLQGGSALELLGYQKTEGQSEDAWNISAEGLKATAEINLNKTAVTFAERIGGRKMSFTYNGVTKSIELPKKEDLENAKDDAERLQLVEDALKNGLNEAFGENRIEVIRNNDNSFSFKTIRGEGVADNGSTLVLSGGDKEVVGTKGVFQVNSGESNRVNLNAKLSESGLKAKFSGNVISINDKEIEIKEEDTVADLMERIKKETGVTVSYQSLGDKFTFTAKEEGATGQVKLDKNAAELFGFAKETEKTGQDAEIAVKYGDSGEVITLYRSSNSFNLDGLTVSVNGTFGNYVTEPDGTENWTSEAVTFDAKADTEKAVDTIKKMVEEYNEILELVNKEASTRPDRSYAPLTSEQKKELGEDEAKIYEEKAKEGILFGDSDLRALSRDLRYIISSVDQEELRKIGISTSGSYADNGKLEFDENKFKAALEADPQHVQELFTKENGIADNMRDVFDKYARTTGATKGVLVEKAGSVKSPLSITRNAIYKQMEAIDKIIAGLERRKTLEEDRYIKQFTSLESLISQMNSQSSWLSQFGGGY